MKILKILGIGKENAGNGGIVNLISEHSGKISFRRSVPILILTAIVAPDVATNGLTWLNLTAMGIVGAIYVLPKLFAKD